MAPRSRPLSNLSASPPASSLQPPGHPLRRKCPAHRYCVNLPDPSFGKPVQKFTAKTQSSQRREELVLKKLSLLFLSALCVFAVNFLPCLSIKNISMSEEFVPQHEVTLRFLGPAGEVNFFGNVHGGAVMKWIDEAATPAPSAGAARPRHRLCEWYPLLPTRARGQPG